LNLHDTLKIFNAKVSLRWGFTYEKVRGRCKSPSIFYFDIHLLIVAMNFFSIGGSWLMAVGGGTLIIMPWDGLFSAIFAHLFFNRLSRWVLKDFWKFKNQIYKKIVFKKLGFSEVGLKCLFLFCFMLHWQVLYSWNKKRELLTEVFFELSKILKNSPRWRVKE